MNSFEMGGLTFDMVEIDVNMKMKKKKYSYSETFLPPVLPEKYYVRVEQIGGAWMYVYVYMYVYAQTVRATQTHALTWNGTDSFYVNTVI